MLLLQYQKILRNQEQIKAQNTTIINSLSVVLDNTTPQEQEKERMKEVLGIPVKSLRAFESLNLSLKKDKEKRLKLVILRLCVLVLSHF